MSSLERKPWWEHRFSLLMLMVMSTIPLWFTSLPPLIDFLGHMGRYHIQTGLSDSPALQQNWDFQWKLIGNLGIDLLIVPLIWLFGIEQAAWIVAALLPPLMIWGLFRAAKAVHGSVPASTLLALPFVLAYPYQYGFVNYWLGLGLAFHVFAAWVATAHSEKWRHLRLIAFALASIIVWISHVYSWAVLTILVGGYQFALLDKSDWRRWPSQALIAIWQSRAVLPPLLLMILWRQNGDGAPTDGWFFFTHKISGMIFTLRDQNKIFDVSCLTLVILFIYYSVRSKFVIVDQRLSIAAISFFILLIILPFRLFGSAYADARLWPILFIVALLAINVKVTDNSMSKGTINMIAVVAICIFTLRIAVSSAGYYVYDRDYKSHLKALDYVETGSKILFLAGSSTTEPWRRSRVEHLGSMAIVRKDAFVNSQWDVPGAQLLIANGALGTAFNTDPSQFFANEPTTKREIESSLTNTISRIPKDYFSYVWIMNAKTSSPPQFPGLVMIYADNNSSLYKIARDQK